MEHKIPTYYREKLNWKKENNPHNWEKGCKYCRDGFKEDEKFVRIDIGYTQFRGDDEVHCFHKRCWKELKDNT